MIAIATLISAVASLVVAGTALYSAVKTKKDTAQKMAVVAEHVPSLAKAINDAAMAADALKSGGKK